MVQYLQGYNILQNIDKGLRGAEAALRTLHTNRSLFSVQSSPTGLSLKAAGAQAG